MASQVITVQLPEPLYKQVKARAQQMQRSVEDELVAVVAAALPTIDELPTDITDELAQLTFLTDEELWQAARTTLNQEQSERMQALISKKQRDNLSPQEEEEAQQLAHYSDKVMLIRAQAAVLLKERGHDISTLTKPTAA